MTAATAPRGVSSFATARLPAAMMPPRLKWVATTTRSTGTGGTVEVTGTVVVVVVLGGVVVDAAEFVASPHPTKTNAVAASCAVRRNMALIDSRLLPGQPKGTGVAM